MTRILTIAGPPLAGGERRGRGSLRGWPAGRRTRLIDFWPTKSIVSHRISPVNPQTLGVRGNAKVAA
jgi:hypothetical protein